jgi:predicted O-linked N-acetylglucosamine transferase (SPINDLY family)
MDLAEKFVPAMPASEAAGVDMPFSTDSVAQKIEGPSSAIELIEYAGRLQQQGLKADAEQLYQQWIESHPQDPFCFVACFNWGILLSEQLRHEDAEQVFRKALELNPSFVQARLNLGHQLEHLGRANEALQQWLAVVVMTQNSTASDLIDLRLHALNNLGRLSEQLHALPQAETYLKHSLLIKPDQNEVMQHYVHLRQKQCAWPVHQPVGEVTLNQLWVNTSPLAMLSATDDPAMQLLATQRFVHHRVPPVQGPATYLQAMPRTGKVKIGYLSGDLHMHAVGLLTAELYALHDRSRFEVHAFCWSTEDGTALRQRLMQGFDQVHSLASLSDDEAALKIRECGIDVLVDLQGLTQGARPGILGRKPAPAQVSYLGLPGTSGLPGVEWILADEFVMPLEEHAYYTEKPLMIEGCYQVSDRQRLAVPALPRSHYGLPEDTFVFASFNNTFKFTERLFTAWMRILRQVPNSLLWLLVDNETARQNLLRTATEHGVDSARLMFAQRVHPAEYLSRFQCIDLMLDTFPYNAGTTANDALWMGAPIVTLSGRSYISRMCGSLLTNVGLPELVTYSLSDYERLAVTIGREPARAVSYRRYLSEQGRKTALFDIPKQVQRIEDAFERLALQRRAQFGGAPQHLEGMAL